MGGTAQKKKRGALHKLGKMLRGGGKGSKQPPAGAATAAVAAAAAGSGLPPRPRPNPGALTAPLGHSMREHEASALQERLLRERRGQEEHAVLPRLDSGASSGPRRALPAMQEQKEQGGRHVPQLEQPDPSLGLQQPLSAAVDAAGGEGWSDYTAAWVQQQQRAQRAQRHEEQAAVVVERAPAQQQRPGSGLSDVPLGGATYAAAAKPGGRLDSPRRQQRPRSGLSEAPVEAHSYLFPDAAAAGYAAGLAAAEAEGLAASHPAVEVLHTPMAAPVRWHQGIDAAAEGLGRSPSPSPSWQQRDLHVVLNSLFEGGEGGTRRQR